MPINQETDGSNRTSYVISCPTASPACAISPNLTLTEGPSTARYVTSNTFGYVMTLLLRPPICFPLPND